MICATVAEETIDEALKWGREARKWADMLELRLDYLNEPEKFPTLLDRLKGPYMVTCRSPEQGGEFTGPDRDRFQLLAEAASRNVDYVDVDVSVPEEERERIGGTQVLSYHNFEETPDDIDEILGELQQKDVDYVKIATRCTDLEDALQLMDLKPGGTRPIIVLGMGEFGLITRLLYRKTHSMITFGAANPTRPAAPGQPSVEELRKEYRVHDVDQSTDVYGVIGDPVSHSRSPDIFNTLFDEHDMNAIYVPFRMVRSDTLSPLAHQLDLQGASVTIPHKRTVIPFLHSLNPYAAQIGAVNTIVKIEDRYEGYNTDARAALDAVVDCWPNDDLDTEEDEPLDGIKVLLLGAGGAARAGGTAFLQAGAEVIVTNRTDENGRELADELDTTFVPWEDRVDVEAPDLIVNSTSVGMEPMEDMTPFPSDALAAETVVFDMVYTPSETRLLREADEQGCHTISGVEMFARQALQQFKLWTDTYASREELPDLEGA
jgi:3-dehydroquinate dehydratase/shikimate dehydrogenase